MTMPLDKLAETVAKMTPAPWRYAQLLDGIEARALLDGSGYHFGQIDDLENGHGIALLRNVAAELIEVARAAAPAEKDTYGRGFRIMCDDSCGCPQCRLRDALAALDAKLGGEGKTFKSKAPIWEPEY